MERKREREIDGASARACERERESQHANSSFKDGELWRDKLKGEKSDLLM